MADGDEIPTITDQEDARWVAAQRKIAESYLQSQGCDHAGVSLEPRWFLRPYLAVWAVRSKVNPDTVGWWAISGDVPTDYMTATCAKLRIARDAIRSYRTEYPGTLRNCRSLGATVE